MHASAADVTGQAQGNFLAGMKLKAVIERDLATGLIVGRIPGISGAHSQGETIQEVQTNIFKIIELLRSEDALVPESEFIATTALIDAWVVRISTPVFHRRSSESILLAISKSSVLLLLRLVVLEQCLRLRA